MQRQKRGKKKRGIDEWIAKAIKLGASSEQQKILTTPEAASKWVRNARKRQAYNDKSVNKSPHNFETSQIPSANIAPGTLCPQVPPIQNPLNPNPTGPLGPLHATSHSTILSQTNAIESDSSDTETNHNRISAPNVVKTIWRIMDMEGEPPTNNRKDPLDRVLTTPAPMSTRKRANDAEDDVQTYRTRQASEAYNECLDYIGRSKTEVCMSCACLRYPDQVSKVRKSKTKLSDMLAKIDKYPDSQLLCNHCRGVLERKQFPAITISNKMDVCETPPSLRDLNWMERQVIAPKNLFLKVIPYGHGVEIGHKGLCVLLPVPTEEIIQSMPLTDEGKPIKVVRPRNQYQDPARSKPMDVNTRQVLNAITELRDQYKHPAFKDFRTDDMEEKMREVARTVVEPDHTSESESESKTYDDMSDSSSERSDSIDDQYGFGSGTDSEGESHNIAKQYRADPILGMDTLCAAAGCSVKRRSLKRTGREACNVDSLSASGSEADEYTDSPTDTSPHKKRSRKRKRRRRKGNRSPARISAECQTGETTHIPTDKPNTDGFPEEEEIEDEDSSPELPGDDIRLMLPHDFSACLEKEGKWVLPWIENQPENDISKPNVEAYCFPHLYADGKNTFAEKRPLGHTKLYLNQFIQTRLDSVHPQFRKDVIYMFWLHIQKLKHLLNKSVSHAMQMTKRSGKQSNRKGTGNNESAYDLPRDQDELRQMLPTVEELLQSAGGRSGKDVQSHAVLSSIPGTKAYWDTCMSEAFAMLREFGPPHLFVTINPNPREWPEFLKQVKPELTYEQIRKISSRE
ncbi:MAG TPA: DUF6570 domain-containing protein, partial [Oculatellaceae cyanobacterium]